MFITFEGIDFSGKSTQVKLLSEYLQKENKNVKVLREPGGTFVSEKIREILLTKDEIHMSDAAELLLFSAARSQLVREVILPALEKNYYVISDRFHDSTIAYQAYGRGLDIEFTIQLQKFAINNALPDITFFIDIPIEEIVNRRHKFELDRIERSNGDFYRKVREGYLKLYKSEERYIKIDGTKTIEEIHKIIVKEIKKLESKRNDSHA
ncbi:MAG: dTMP kinase [Ignavibacteria bacterium]|jgi:dTMP kinase